MICAGGEYSNAGASSCLACPAGSYSNPGSSSCALCSKGQYSSQGSQSCSICPPGSFSEEGAESCAFCPDGTYFTGAGGPSGPCTKCSAGYYSKKGATSCLICSANQYSLEGAGECLACETGYYSSPGASECYPTPNSVPTDVASVGVSAATMAGGGLCIGSSMFANLGLMTKVLQNMRYMNIGVSSDLKNAFKTWSTKVVSLKIPDGLIDSSGSQNLPFTFAQYDVDPIFLVNYWSSLMIALIGVGCFVFFHGVKFLLKEKLMKRKLVSSVIDFMILASFNFIIIQIYGTLDEIVLYLILQLRFGELSIISLMLAVLLLLLGILILILHFGIVYKYKELKKQGDTEALDRFLKSFEYFQVLYQDFKETTVFRHSFFAWLILRTILFNLIIVMLYEKPLFQAISFMLINLVMLGVLISEGPFKEISGNVTQFFYETVVFIAYFCVLVMAIADETKKEAVDLRETLSKSVMLLNVILLIGSLAFVSIQLCRKIAEIHDAYKEYKKQGKRRIKEIGKETLRDRLTLETSRNVLFNPDFMLESDRSAYDEVKNQDQKTKSVEINFGNDASMMPTQEEDLSYYFGPKYIQRRMKPKSIFMTEKSAQAESKLVSFHASPSKEEEEEEEKNNFNGEPSSERQEQRLMEFKRKARIRNNRRLNSEILGLDLALKDSPDA